MVSQDICSTCCSPLRPWLLHALTITTGLQVHCTVLQQVFIFETHKIRKGGLHGSLAERRCVAVHSGLHCARHMCSLSTAEPRTAQIPSNVKPTTT